MFKVLGDGVRELGKCACMHNFTNTTLAASADKSYAVCLPCTQLI